MKLAIVRQKYTPYGGAERFVSLALDTLRDQGVAVEIIARQWQGEAAGVRCDPFYFGRTWRDAGFAHCVRRVIDSGRYDLVQSHERIPGCHIFRAGDGVHATWLELSRKPLARLSPWHRYTLAAEAAMYCDPNLRAVICNSRMVRDDVERRFGVAADRLHVIYNGVDTARFHLGLRDEFRKGIREKLGVGAMVPVILFVGSGFERKGVATLLAAIAQMERHDAVAVVVGRDRHTARYKSLAQKLGVAERIRFLGGQEDVRPFYGAADIFCLPTLYDPMPNAALEAMACGLPIVTTPDCGAAELLVEGSNGFVRAVDDPKGIHDVLNLLCDGSLAIRVGANAAATAEGYNMKGMAAHLIALYNRLLGQAADKL